MPLPVLPDVGVRVNVGGTVWEDVELDVDSVVVVVVVVSVVVVVEGEVVFVVVETEVVVVVVVVCCPIAKVNSP